MAEAVGRVEPVDIVDEMKQSYIDYAMSVIASRALPDVRDGLKPVHRRILFAMHESGNTADRSFRKSAKTVGEVIGNYHPHGDVAVYDALVRLAQDFAMRQPLIEGHGNFGSIDGDPPAAMRYCVTGETLVVTDRGLLRADSLSPDGEEDVALEVLSLDGRVNRASKWFDCGPFPTRRVWTRRGYEVTGTTNHPLLTCVEGSDGRPSLSWKTIGEIRPGDWVVLDRSGALWPAEAVDLSAFHPVLPPSSRVERHALPGRLDEDLAFLLGALTAEGTCRSQVVEFTNVPGDFAAAFEAAWHRAFPTCRLHVFRREAVGYGRQPFLQVQVVSSQVIGFLGNLGLHGKSAERTVPETILRSPMPVAAAFLRGLFEGDGAVERSGRSLLRVGLVSKSRTLLARVQTLLLRFGIASSLGTERARGMHRLMIVGETNVRRFGDAIGFASRAKRQALGSVLSAYSGRVLSQTDYVPFLAEFVRGAARRGQREWLGKHNFDRPERLEGALPRLRQALPLQHAAYIEGLAAPHYLFEQVAGVEDAGERRVYSVRVDSDCHSFVANGFVNHNTEARLSKLAAEMLRDLDRNTVDFVPNYDDKAEEPVVLPARFPNLLVNGSAGIAVGMATNIPPHNLREAIDATLALIDAPESSVRDLMRHIKGPDFPTGALIMGREGIRQAYETGRGIITMRGCARIEEQKGGRQGIVISEIPYQVLKSKLIERIAELVREKRLEGVADLRDETDRTGLRVVIELSRGANANVVLNRLYRDTPLQQSFGIILLALVDGRPQVLSLRQLIQHYLAHQREVVVRRTRFDLERAEKRAHILEGLRIALDHIDAVVALIRGSKTVEAARTGLMARFGLDEVQADAILEMRLQRLTGLEREKIEEEYRGLQRDIEAYRAILASDKLVDDVIRRELGEVRQRFGEPRRTEIAAAAGEFTDEDLIAEEQVLVSLTHRGYIKRTAVDTYRSQGRGGRGVAGMATRDEDFVTQLFTATTHAAVIFFTSRGRAHRLKVYEIPEAGRTARGTAVVNLIQLEAGEKVTAVIPVPATASPEDSYLFMATRNGIVKKVALDELSSVRRGGIVALTLDEGDELIDVALTDGGADVLLATRGGRALRFAETDVRPTGRTARGVHGIACRKGDAVVGMGVIRPDAALLVVSERGIGKRTPLSEFGVHHRGAQGVRAMTLSQGRTGKLAGVQVVRPGDEVMLISAQGIVIRLASDAVSVQSRGATGVSLMKLDTGDQVVAVARLAAPSENGD